MKYGIEVVKPDYVFIKLIPNNSLKNTQTHLIARTIANMYKSLWQTVIREDEKVVNLFKRQFSIGTKWSLKQQGKIGYFVYLEKTKIEFYFIIPQHYYSVMKERITGVWNGITIEEVPEIPTFSDDAFKYQMVYEKEDGLSLATDRKNNDFLTASLNVVDLLEDGDKAGVLFNFAPISQESFKYAYKSTMDKVKNGVPTDRKKTGVKYLLKMGLSIVDTLLKDIAEVLAGKSVKKSEEDGILDGIIERMNGGKQISVSTEKKIRGQLIDTQILVVSESKHGTKFTERSYATSLAQSFDVVSGDNRLVKRAYNGKVDYRATRIEGAESMRVWDEEAQNFLAIAGREILEKYPFMGRIETQETQIPKDLQTGVMCIGETTFRGHSQKAYLSDDEQFKKLMLLLIGPTRAGKSNLISHLCIDAIENGECVVIMDYIKKCELSRDVASCFPADKVLRITFDDIASMQGLGYNEVGISDDPFKRYGNAKKQTTNTLTLINAINDGSGDNTRLSPKMERYLESACLVVYMSGGSIKDIFGVLLNHETRHRFISQVPAEQMEFMQDYVDGLREIDETNKDGDVTGTRVQAGIIDRLNALKKNPYMELMLKKGVENNVNLVEEMQRNQVIVIEMPQAMFTTDGEKDILTTYWMTKIWLALQVRADTLEEDDIKKVNLVIDEIYQVQHTEMFLKSKLSQIAKFGMKPIVSCHYINQLKYMRDELRSANASYMLIAGCDKKNFAELRDELYPFIDEDLQNLKRYHSMNYVKTKDGYASFITKLPPKVSTRVKLTQKNAPLVD